MPFPPIPKVGRIWDSANNPDRRWEPVGHPPVLQPPQPSVGLQHEPTHQAHQASQPSGPAAPTKQQLPTYVPPGGLHPIAGRAGAIAEAMNELRKALEHLK